MNLILLTQSGGLLGPIAKLLGVIMNAIFNVISLVGLPNIGLAIILFTIVMYLLMMPLTIKQQKFSKLQAKMNPEIQAIQAKYKGRSDQASMMAQNTEIQGVYSKYGVSPSGSCLQLLIQMPILFALYRVIYAMPAYVGKIGDTFRVLADKIYAADGGKFLLDETQNFSQTVSMYGKSLVNAGDNVEMAKNGIIDILNKLSSTDMATVTGNYADLSTATYNGKMILTSGGERGLIDIYNNFLGLNIGDSPMNLIKTGSLAIIIGAIMIPLLAAVTQWINVKLMPQPEASNGNDTASTMNQSLKTMNMMMPIMSAVFCLTLPAGMGLYWIAGSVVRSVQQVVVNKHLDKLDISDIIAQNAEKSAKKMEKLKQNQERMAAYANVSTRNIQTKANTSDNSQRTSQSTQSAPSYSEVTPAKKGSMREKANMVKKFNENDKKDN